MLHVIQSNRVNHKFTASQINFTRNVYYCTATVFVRIHGPAMNCVPSCMWLVCACSFLYIDTDAMKSKLKRTTLNESEARLPYVDYCSHMYLHLSYISEHTHTHIGPHNKQRTYAEMRVICKLTAWLLFSLYRIRLLWPLLVIVVASRMRSKSNPNCLLIFLWDFGIAIWHFIYRTNTQTQAIPYPFSNLADVQTVAQLFHSIFLVVLWTDRAQPQIQ